MADDILPPIRCVCCLMFAKHEVKDNSGWKPVCTLHWIHAKADGLEFRVLVAR